MLTKSISGIFLLCAFLSALLTVHAHEPIWPEKSERAKVLIIGTVHAPQCFFAGDGYSNAHLRVTLQKFQPTVVGVESNPVWFSRGILNQVAHESRVAVSWASQHGAAVYGVDWVKLEDLAEFNRIGLKHAREQAPQADTLDAFRERAVRLEKYVGPQSLLLTEHSTGLFQWVNTVGADEEWSQRQAALLKGDESALSLDYRDSRITSQIVALAERYPGSRIAIVVGYGHKGSLDQKLSDRRSLEVVRWHSLSVPTPNEIEAAWEPIDSLGTLRESLDSVLYYFNPEAVNVKRVEDHLLKLSNAGIQIDEVRYLQARYLVLTRKYSAAEAILSALILSEAESAFSYPLTNGWWNIPVSLMARIELARIHDLKGERQHALDEYREVLKTLESSTPEAPPEESFPDLEAWITDGHSQFYEIWTRQSAIRVLLTLIEEPFMKVHASPPTPK